MNNGFARFVHKNRIESSRLIKAIEEIEMGLVEADLGGGLIKKRVPREGGGKRGGYRIIIAYRRHQSAFFIYGFPKNVAADIDDNDLEDLRELAKVYEGLNEGQLREAILKGVLLEAQDGKKV